MRAVSLWCARDARTGRELVYQARGARAGLLAELGRKSARPIYCDKRDGRTVRVGWYVAGGWWDVYRLEPLERER